MYTGNNGYGATVTYNRHNVLYPTDPPRVSSYDGNFSIVAAGVLLYFGPHTIDFIPWSQVISITGGNREALEQAFGLDH